MRAILSCCLALLIFTPAAHAGDYDLGDWTLSILSADTGMLVGAVGGGVLGQAMAKPCEEDDDEDDSCFLHGLTETLIGAATGGTLGVAAGAWSYGELQGRDGSFTGALLGATLGGAASFAVAWGTCGGINNDLICPVFSAAGLLILPGLGATMGYLMGEPDAGPTSGALIDLNMGHARLSLPAVTITPLEDRGFGVFMPLIGGRL